MLVFLGYRTSIARYVAKWGIALICLCKRRHQGGGIAPSWGIAAMAEKVSRDRGYRSDTIAISRDMVFFGIDWGSGIENWGGFDWWETFLRNELSFHSQTFF